MGTIGLVYYQSAMQLADDTDSSIITNLLAIIEEEFKKHPKDFSEVLINDNTLSFKTEKYDWFRFRWWRHTLSPVTRGSFSIKKQNEKVLIISKYVFSRVAIFYALGCCVMGSIIYLSNPFPIIMFCLLIVMPLIWFFFLTAARVSVDIWSQNFLNRSIKRAGGIIQKYRVEEDF